MANLSNVQIDQDLSGTILLPEGNYKIFVVDAKDTTTKKGDEMVTVTFEVADGDFAGVKLKHYFTFHTEWGAKFAKMYANASGMGDDFVADNVMMARAVEVEIEIEEGKPWIDSEGEEREGRDQNKINPFSWKSID